MGSYTVSDWNGEEDYLYGLEEGEKWWRDHYEMLKRYGYELRPRFRPGWKPSWVQKQKDPLLCEDGHPNLHSKVIDAVRLSDQARVAIKKLRKGSEELSIVRYLTSDELRKDPRNNVVPLLDVFSDDDDVLEFMVMPLLIKFDQPPFTSVDEVIDFMTQTLTGMSFIHSKGIAHRDCSILNIMMDGSGLYPKGFHPGSSVLDAAAKGLANPRHRRDVSSVRYYFTDFGISSWFTDGSGSHLVTGKDCQDRQLPELYQDGSYDPFCADIFILGNVFRRFFVRKYEHLEFLAPLSEAMTQKDPKARPTVDAALELLNDIVEHQSVRCLLRLLLYRNADSIDRLLCGLGSLRREATLLIKSYLPSGKKKLMAGLRGR